MSVSYLKAGVNIAAGNTLVERIKPFAKATARVGTDSQLGGFGGLFDLAACKYKDPILVSATDGVGTKLKIAFEVGKHDTVGIDLVAMCVNDLVVQGAEPLFFLDYFATSALDVESAKEVIKGISQGCIQAGAALIGGETAEMPGMYQPGHYDLAGFAVGAVERTQLLPRADIQAGDVVLGIASSGLHSNGFSLVRHVVADRGLSYHDAAPFLSGHSLGEALLTPTRIYVKSCLPIIQNIKALAHITGGGLLENIPRILPEGTAVMLDGSAWPVLPVFKWLRTIAPMTHDEYLRTFNTGIGMVVVVAPDQEQMVTLSLKASGEKVYKIGQVLPRTAEAVIYEHAEALYGQ